MMLPSALVGGLASAALWLGWSVLVGAAANQLPMAWLVQARDGRHGGGNIQVTAALRRYERWWLMRRWRAWIPDAGPVLPGGVRKASLMGRDHDNLERLLAEIRRAELVHWALWPAWMVTMLWLPPQGVLINLIFATLFNGPCLVLQRYNCLRVRQLLMMTSPVSMEAAMIPADR